MKIGKSKNEARNEKFKALFMSSSGAREELEFTGADSLLVSLVREEMMRPNSSMMSGATDDESLIHHIISTLETTMNVAAQVSPDGTTIFATTALKEIVCDLIDQMQKKHFDEIVDVEMQVAKVDMMEFMKQMLEDKLKGDDSNKNT